MNPMSAATTMEMKVTTIHSVVEHIYTGTTAREICNNIVHNRHVAEDLFHELMAYFLIKGNAETMERIIADNQFDFWFAAIVKRQIGCKSGGFVSRLRSDKVYFIERYHEDAFKGIDEGEGSEIDLHQLVDDVESTLDWFDRMIWTQYWTEKKPMRKIAKDMGLHENSIQRRIAKIKLKMRDEFDSRNNDD